MLTYYLSGGFKFNKLLKKTPHKDEHEKQIKKDHASASFSLLIKDFIILFVVFLILWLLGKKLPDALMGLLIALSFCVWYGLIAAFADERKRKRKEIISNICNNCFEYNKFTRDEKLVDVEHEIETESFNRSVDIKSKSGHVIGTAEIPEVIPKVIRKETYYVTKTCNCCGKVFYYYETRRKVK